MSRYDKAPSIRSGKPFDPSRAQARLADSAEKLFLSGGQVEPSGELARKTRAQRFGRWPKGKPAK